LQIPRPGVSFVASLATIAAIIMITNYFDEQYSVLASSYSNLVITVLLVVFSVALLAKYGIRGDFGKALVCFVLFVILWFVAERVWMIDELVYHVDPWPSKADFFWLVGYPSYFAFTIFYLRPFKKLISIRLLTLVFGLVAVLGASMTYYATLQQSDISYSDMLLGLSYPIFDSFLLVPIALGLILFVKGQVNFVWSCLMFGMLSFVIADYGFLIFSLDTSYHTGHPIDIPYLWAYLFFLFGVINYAKIFRKQNSEIRFEDQDKFR
jgi:hypothetical protein